ncbi:hypothetical protein DRE_02216 [Drechslerella stenobrocha 248]|uniref:Translational machinery component n=1 Tax=Drechslerella stenobrocha 248 TaxID=1043628 RepID=W7I8P3_9PEZI|nr:hypothetical protein DRE_02216 [Drechslerella stenobrocha 248]
MASARSMPLMLRTARASTSTTSHSTFAICTSSSRPSPTRWMAPSTSRRAYASTWPPTDAPNVASDTNKPRLSLNQIATELPTLGQSPGSSTYIPSPIPADAASSIPKRDTIFNTARGRGGGPPSRGYGRGIDATLAGNANAEYPPGATIIDPWRQLFHLHVYSTKHNTHITFTDPRKQAIVSCSTGVLGFRKAGRHTYDAAYQLAAHVFQKIEEKGVIPKKVEVIMRGFGVGREAFTKALLGKEGGYLKDVVVRVTDATRTKFGGHRSKKPRRL